jgi:3-hydroxybutyryl-CoA dehydrogenase
MPKVAIIGAGPLGRWLALAAARAGYSVLLEDVMPANLHHAQEYIRQQYALSASASSDLGNEFAENSPGVGAGLNAVALSSGGSAVTFASTIEEAVRDADLAIDCVPDELESKLEIFWLLDRMAPPHTVLITPTTRLSISDLAACTYRPEKCIAVAIEARDLIAGRRAAEGRTADLLLRTGSRTSQETVALVKSFWEHLGFATRFEADTLNP